MRITEDVVKTTAGDVWKYQIDLPDSIEEAIELFGADGALALLNSGLKVKKQAIAREPVSYTHLRAHETVLDLVCRLLLEKKNKYFMSTSR